MAEIEEPVVDTPLKLHIKEKNLVLLQKLDMNRLNFAKNLQARITQEQVVYQMSSAGETKFHIQLGTTPAPDTDTVIIKSDWICLGVYESLTNPEDQSERHVWVHAWKLAPELSTSTELKAALDHLPEGLSPFKSPIIESHDPMMISYMMAFLTDTLKLEHIYVRENDEGGHFTAFGMRNIEWSLAPTPKEEPKEEQPLEQTQEPDVEN